MTSGKKETKTSQKSNLAYEIALRSLSFLSAANSSKFKFIADESQIYELFIFDTDENPP